MEGRSSLMAMNSTRLGGTAGFRRPDRVRFLGAILLVGLTLARAGPARSADGPEAGTPETVSQCDQSHTGRFLREAGV